MIRSWIRFLPRFVKVRLENRHELQRVIDNTGWLFADKIIRMGLGLLVGVWVARYLGPEQFGLLSFAGSFATLFLAIALLGLESIVVRELVRTPDSQDALLGAAFFLRLISGAVSFAAALLTIFFIRPEETATHMLVALAGSALIFQAFDVIDLWFQSEVKSRYVVLAKNGAFICSTTIKVALILVKSSLVAFAIANALELGLGAMGLVVVYRRNGRSIFHWSVQADKIRLLLKESLPLVLSGIVFTIYLRIDQVMLGQMVGDKAVGIYAAAVRVAEIWYFIPTAVVSSLFPNIIKARDSDEGEFYKRLQKLYKLMAFLGYAVAIPVTCFSGLIINLLFGKAYASAGPMLALLVWAGLFANLTVARNAYLFAMNWSRALLGAVAFGAVVNVFLNILLIPPYGGMGAVIASLVSYWCAAHGISLLYRPLFKTGRMITCALLYPKFW